MRVDRRTFLTLAGGACLTLLGPLVPRSLAASTERYLSACRLPDGSFAAVEFGPEGADFRVIPLPGRGHGFAVSGDRGRAVAFARYPLSFAVAFPIGGRGSAEPVAFAAPEGRHFYGHGVFADNDRLLLATENDFDGGRGVIGVYDVGSGFKRIGEFETHGVGPHEVVMMPDGRTLAIANGGIETHPDAGDAKLNLAEMSPSLAFLDATNGDLLAEHRLPPDLHQLSIRHLAVDGRGSVWFGCQYEGPASDQPPLLGRVAREMAPVMVEEGAALRLALRNDITSVAANADGSVIAASSPTGGLVVFVTQDGTPLGSRPLAAAAGLAAHDHRFLATAASGALVEIDERSETPATTADFSFDNHLKLAS